MPSRCSPRRCLEGSQAWRLRISGAKIEIEMSASTSRRGQAGRSSAAVPDSRLGRPLKSPLLVGAVWFHRFIRSTLTLQAQRSDRDKFSTN